MAHVFFDAHYVEIDMGNGTLISAFVPNKRS
jgi:hypothetical protein